MHADRKLSIKVFSPFQVYFEGTAVSLSAINKTGPFDVLVDHSNFFSKLEAGRVAVDTGFDHIEIEIAGGILQVSNNKVTLFANV